MKEIHPLHGRNLQPRIRAAKVLMILACILGTATARANSTSAPSYVPAQNIPCSYGLSIDDLKSAGPALEHALRPDVAVRVSIDARGQISDAVVEQSSGNPAFDNLALLPITTRLPRAHLFCRAHWACWTEWRGSRRTTANG
jgi:hypothetical protein